MTLKEEFDIMYFSKVQQLSSSRATQMSQADIARLSEVSLRTIQRFENYKFKSHYLLFVYNKIFYK